MKKVCEGNCKETHGECSGEVQKVIVSGQSWKPMTFDYCENAISEDIDRGFNVEVVDEFKQQQLAQKAEYEPLDANELFYLAA